MDPRLASMLMELLFVSQVTPFATRDEINPEVWDKTFPPFTASVASTYRNIFGSWMLIHEITRRMR